MHVRWNGASLPPSRRFVTGRISVSEEVGSPPGCLSVNTQYTYVVVIRREDLLESSYLIFAPHGRRSIELG